MAATRRQFLEAVQGSTRIGAPEQCMPVEGRPGQQVNVFTDGALDPPDKPERARMGLGVFCPSGAEVPAGL
eukprot:1812488-Alexandrium_andersonii.AAC.1